MFVPFCHMMQGFVTGGLEDPLNSNPLKTCPVSDQSFHPPPQKKKIISENKTI